MEQTEDFLSDLPEKILFYKFSASANDFIVLDNRTGLFTQWAGELSRRLCSHRYSVGADGLILIENSNKASFRMRFFNPDGNEFNTCGNGGRCAARFGFLNVISSRKMTIETNIGVVEAEVNGTAVKLQFVGPSKVRLYQSVTVEGKIIKGHYVRLGDPHFVVFARDIRKHPIVPLAKKIRYNEAFQPEGTNVHFIEPVSRQQLKIRTYERGIEGETLACGSGCISASVATFLSNQTEPPILFEPQSGIPLTVHFNPGNEFQDVFLEGDARLIYKGELTKEALTGFPVNP